MSRPRCGSSKPGAEDVLSEPVLRRNYLLGRLDGRWLTNEVDARPKVEPVSTSCALYIVKLTPREREVFELIGT